MATYEFYRPDADLSAWPMNLLAVHDLKPERWRVYNLRLCDTYLVQDNDGVRQNHPEAWLWFAWRTENAMLLTGNRDPDAYGFALENPYDAVLEAVGGEPVRQLTPSGVDEVSVLEFATARIELAPCCRELAARCLSDARAQHRRRWWRR